MPYRIDLNHASPDAFDRLVDLGALDIDTPDGHLAAIMPDDVAVDRLSDLFGPLRVSAARGRDAQSVWVLGPKAVRTGQLQIVPAAWPPRDGALRMVDAPAFGTGLHPTTALCLEAIEDECLVARPSGVLDVGTGSGILALAALHAGVPRALALDVDADAVRVAAENARLNRLAARLHVVLGGPEVLSGTWPLVVANILAALLIEMAPALSRLVARRGRLLLSGIRSPLAAEVEHAYRHLGLRRVQARTRDGWTALTFQASW